MNKVIIHDIGKADSTYLRAACSCLERSQPRAAARRIVDAGLYDDLAHWRKLYVDSLKVARVYEAVRLVREHFRSTSLEHIGLLPQSVTEEEMKALIRSEWLALTKHGLYRIACNPTMPLALQAGTLSDARVLHLI